MDLLKTILLYLSMLYVSSVQIAPDPATVNITPTPIPTAAGIYASAEAMPVASPVPTPSITANPAYGQLVMGDRNDTVKSVQVRLQELGYYTGRVDSAYGNQTRRAVEEFQYQNGLTVDGIAGRFTQTILFESKDVKAAPTEVPAFLPDQTSTPPPVTAVPILPPETAAPVQTATPAPEPTELPDVTLPALMDRYSFVLEGFSEPLKLQGSELALHPVELDEALYIPLVEIVRSTGGVIIENTEENKTEIAFSVLTDFYQVSYTQNEDGSLSDIVFEKNAQPQPMAIRSAVVLNGIFYLPLEDMGNRTDIVFAMDDGNGIITVTMPTAGM